MTGKDLSHNIMLTGFVSFLHSKNKTAKMQTMDKTAGYFISSPKLYYDIAFKANVASKINNSAFWVGLGTVSVSFDGFYETTAIIVQGNDADLTRNGGCTKYLSPNSVFYF
jgi:hypothetical protein